MRSRSALAGGGDMIRPPAPAVTLCIAMKIGSRDVDTPAIGRAQKRYREISLAQIEGYPELAVLLTVWRAGVVGDLPPGRIDPLAVPRQLLPGAILADVEGRDAVRLRFRLAGTMLCELCGGEMRGRTFDEVLLAADAAAMAEAALVALAEVRPLLVHRPDIRFRDVHLDYVALLLPLTGDDGAVNRVLEMPDPATIRRRRHSDAA